MRHSTAKSPTAKSSLIPSPQPPLARCVNGGFLCVEIPDLSRQLLDIFFTTYYYTFHTEKYAMTHQYRIRLRVLVFYHTLPDLMC